MKLSFSKVKNARGKQCFKNKTDCNFTRQRATQADNHTDTRSGNTLPRQRSRESTRFLGRYVFHISNGGFLIFNVAVSGYLGYVVPALTPYVSSRDSAYSPHLFFYSISFSCCNLDRTLGELSVITKKA